MNKYKNGRTMVLAHYYTSPEVQNLADYVGDSLQLAQIAATEQPERLVFASVRFMAEQAKILLPNTEVLLPDELATCSLVEMTDVDKLKAWKKSFADGVLVSYVNSSVQQKAISDVIVTSSNVVDVIQYLTSQGRKVLFANDRNMGAYLKWEFGVDIEVWQDAYCIVHDSFKEDELKQELNRPTDGEKFVIAHPESNLSILQQADFIGSTTQLLQWVKNHEFSNSTVFVATESNILYNMKMARPELDLRPAPTYSGCQCDQCPWMELNTKQLVIDVIDGKAGQNIDYISDDLMKLARKPIERMLEFQKTGELNF